MSLRVEYTDRPEGAQESAVFSAASTQPFSDQQKLATGTEDTPWVSLEPGGWRLDGKGVLWEEQPPVVGWWSDERSGDDGRFEEPPVISVSFPRVYTATGITFRFWPSLQHWCGEMEVYWYSGDTLLQQCVAYPDGPDWVLDQPVEGFDRIVIQLLSTNVPGQFAKLQQLQVGQVVVFFQDEIVQVSLLNEVDPSLCQLSADTMQVEIRARKNRTLIPQKNQSMRLYRGEEQLAAHYIADSSREAQQFYTFRCQSAIGRLEGNFLGGIYTDMPVQQLLNQVLDGFLYELDGGFAQETVTGYLPVCTCREALQQIAFALGAVVTTRGDGLICLSALPEQVTGSFDGSSIFSGAKVNRETQTAAVQIFAHSYMVDTREETLLDGETVQGSGVLFVFSEPHHSYVLTGGTVVDSGANWVRLSAQGQVKLTAKKYVHSVSVRRRENPLATAAEKGNVVSVESATLVHGGNAEQTLDRLYQFCILKNLLTQQVVVSGQQAGALVQSVNPWGTVTEGYITSMESQFTGSGHTADVTIRGIEKAKEES